MFVVEDKLAYFISEDRKTIYPCTIDASSYKVDFKKGRPATKVDSILTESEVRGKLGIRFIDSWDTVSNKVIKVSNKVVTSIVTNKN